MAPKPNIHKRIALSFGGFFLLLMASTSFLGAAEPVITVPPTQVYAKGNLTLTGSITADCFCTVKATLRLVEDSGKPYDPKVVDAALELNEHGQFTHTLSLVNDEKDSAIGITAEVSPRFWFGSQKTGKASITVKPQETPIELVDAPTEWKDREIIFTLKLLSGSSVDLKGGLATVLSSEQYPFKAEWADIPGSTDSRKLVTLKGAFDTDYNQEFEGFKFTVKAKGYKTHEETIRVNNQNYDAKRVAADKEASQREMKLLTMEQFNYGDDIQVAVSRNIPKSRTVGYRYVLNPDTSHFIRILVSVKNASLGEIHVNPNYITLRDSTGYTYNPDEATYGLNYLDAIDLQPGGATSGWLAFIVPKDEKELTLIYSSFDGTITKKIYVQ